MKTVHGDIPKKRRSSAEVQAERDLNGLTMGLVAIMDEVLCIDGNGSGREGYVSGIHECAERIARLIMNGIDSAGKPKT